MTKKRTCTSKDLRPCHYKRACEILNRECGEDRWIYPGDERAATLKSVALHVAETEDFPDKTAEKFEDAWSSTFSNPKPASASDLLTALRKADLIKEVE